MKKYTYEQAKYEMVSNGKTMRSTDWKVEEYAYFDKDDNCFKDENKDLLEIYENSLCYGPEWVEAKPKMNKEKAMKALLEGKVLISDSHHTPFSFDKADMFVRDSNDELVEMSLFEDDDTFEIYDERKSIMEDIENIIEKYGYSASIDGENIKLHKGK